MKKLIIKINDWYDDLPEPRRFLTFFIPMAVGYTIFGMIGGSWFVGWNIFLGFTIVPLRIAGNILKLF